MDNRNRIPPSLIWTPEGRVRILILSAVIIFFISLFMIATLSYTSRPLFCTSCHEINPEYYTWKVSAHKNINCISCHVKPGPGNLAMRNIVGVKQVYQHLFNKFLIPISTAKTIESSTCLQCHNANRVFTPSGDITMPHARHITKGIDCMECHGGVAHGKIAERQVTLAESYDSWSEVVARTQMKPKYSKPLMVQCMECHQQRNITTACSACHTEISDPVSHRDQGWKVNHGKSAEKELEPCITCHAYANIDMLPNDKKITGAPNKAAEFARRNPFCADCHNRRPPSHEIGWMTSHGKDATPDSSSCMVCHNQGRPTSSGLTTKTYCGSCHKGQHRQNWRTQHPQTIDVSQGIKTTCFTCHGIETCSRCHMDKTE